MTFRSVILGLVLATLIAGFGYINDSVLRMTYLVGNHLPISVFGLLILTVILFNPLLFKLRKSWRFSSRELAVMVAMLLVGCSIPGSGLMRTFVSSLVRPIHYYNSTDGWQKHKLMQYVPPQMLAAGGQNDDDVVDAYTRGMKGQGQAFSLWQIFDANPQTNKPNIPWAKWSGTLSFWLPIVLLTAVCVICMSLIVHRQWATRERLRYPIVDVVNALTGQDADRAASPIMRNRLFWVGLISVLVVHIINGLAALYPESMIQIPLTFPMPQIAQTWPKLGSTPGAGSLFSPQIFPTAVAVAFFLAADVSLSLGLSQIIAIPIMAALLAAGIDVQDDYMEGGMPGWQKFGSYLGIALMLAYMGRRYYWNVLKQALTFRKAEEVEPYAAWACRLLIAAAAGMMAMFTWVGLDWPFAVIIVLLILLMFLVMSRINAESGLFFIQPSWQPIGVMLGLFGAFAMGPKAIMIASLICVMLTIDPRESLMPFIVNGLKMCDDKQVRPGRVGAASVSVYVIGLAAAVLVVFWAAYNFGMPTEGYPWATEKVPQHAFKPTDASVTRLEYSNQLQESTQLPTAERFAGLWGTHEKKTKFLYSVGLGLALVLVCGVLRLKYTWWPIHPVMFLVWNSYPLQLVSFSFLLGWIIKSSVTRFGGGSAYRKAIPLMVGIIAGDLLGGLVFMIQGTSYYFIYDVLLGAKSYRIFPT